MRGAAFGRRDSKQFLDGFDDHVIDVAGHSPDATPAVRTARQSGRFRLGATG
jgi:hypothetical protein